MKHQYRWAFLGLLIAAIVTFGAFNAFGSQTASPNPQAATPVSSFTRVPIYPPTPDPNPRPTAVPIPFRTLPGTPLPTPDLGPSPTPRPVVPSPVWTPIPPMVSGWVTFTSKSGFSFSYPQGWYVSDDVIVYPPKTVPSVDIHITNVDPTKVPPKTDFVPGLIGIELINSETSTIPGGSSPFVVGPQNFEGQQIVRGRDDPAIEPHLRIFERSIAIYFTAGNRSWIIAGTMFPPTPGVDRYTEIFYQIVRSLRYEAR